MTRLIACEADLAEGLAALVAADPRWRSMADVAGPLPLRRRAPGFEGLAAIVVAQQLSVASARAIWARFVAAFDPLHPEAIAGASDEALRAAGLSRPKQRTLRAVASAIVEGRLAEETLQAGTAEDIRASLTALNGIGPWTADIYLMFCLGHADAFAPGDLALQEAARLAFGLVARPRPEELARLAEGWSPWRGVAARLLWAYYGAVKTREGAPT